MNATNLNPNNGKATLEDYLKEGMDAGAIDYRLRATYDMNGKIHFYLHPIGRPGKTQDFKIDGNILETKFVSGTFN